MRQSTNDIIQRAKQQPRLGTTPILGALDAALTTGIDSLGLFSEATATTINITGKLTDSFSDTLKAAQSVSNQMLWLEKRNQSLQKAFMMTRKDAASFGQEIDDLSKSFGVGGKVMRAYVENLKGVAKGFAGSATFIKSGFGQQLTKIQDDLIRTMGLSKETANQYTKMMVGRGGNMEEELKKQVAIAEAIKQATGYQDAQKDILEGMSGLSADIEAHYNRIPGSLELGIIKAKQLGLSVEDMYNAGSKMLSVEETINKELELQALTGQRLIDQDGASLINKYQQAQLNGDLNAQADIMSEIMTKMGDTVKTNPYARQALSDLTGLTTAELVSTTREMAIASQTATAIGKESMKSQTAAGVVAKSSAYQGTLEEQRKGGLQTTEGLQANNADIAETAMITSKITDAGKSVDETSNALVKYTEQLGTTFEKLTDAAGGLANIFQGTAMTVALGKSITDAVTTAMSSGTYKLSNIDADNVLINATSIGTGTSAPMVSHNDAVISPNDTVLFSGGVGTLFDDKDYITASTNNPLAKGNGGDNMSQFAAAIVNAIRQQTTALTGNSSMNPPLWT
jgi:hypothetical protein